MNQWERNAKLAERVYGTQVDWEERFYICPECGEPVYECDWGDESLHPYLCPICEFENSHGDKKTEKLTVLVKDNHCPKCGCGATEFEDLYSVVDWTKDKQEIYWASSHHCPRCKITWNYCRAYTNAYNTIDCVIENEKKERVKMLYRVEWSGDIDAYDGTLWHNKDNAIQAIRKALLCKDDYFDDIQKDNLHDYYERDIEDWGDMTYEEWVERTMEDLVFEHVEIEDEED